MDYNSYINYFIDSIKKINPSEIENFIQLIIDAYHSDNTIYIIGNGGSAANASHFAQDLSKGTINNISIKKRIKALSLTDNTAFITALGNDEGFESIFLEQLITFAKPNDILIAISGSGNSKNIINAVTWAKENKITTVGITGFDGGLLNNIADKKLYVPLHDMCTVESIHSFLLHFIVMKIKAKINI